MNKQEKDKKKRSANFSDAEIDLLCELVVKFKETIESKKTDAVTWKEKNYSWEKLTAEFNLINKGTVRTMPNLKMKYESIKKDLRKKVARNKQELFKTGGGVPNISPLLKHEEIIYNLITLSVEGLPARSDDDSLNIFTQGLEEYGHNDNSINEETIFIELDDNSEATPSELLGDLEVPRKKSKFNNSDYAFIDFEATSPTSPTESPSLLAYPKTYKRLQDINIQNKNNLPSTSTSERNINIQYDDGNNRGNLSSTSDKMQIQNDDENNLPSTSVRSISEAANKENSARSPAFSRKWNPTLLKKPITKELNAKKKMLTKVQAAEKVSILAESKKELIQLQIQHAKKELDHIDNENKLKLLKAEKELKNAQLDGELKELEKKIKEHMLRKMTNSSNYSNFDL